MSTERKAPKDIDEYMAGFPNEIREILQKIRMTIRKAAPDAEEAIKYQIPTFVRKGNLVHFAAFRKHIGFYPPARGDEKFRKQMAVYAGAKGNLRFPLDKPIPYALISKMVKLRAKENSAIAEAKVKRR